MKLDVDSVRGAVKEILSCLDKAVVGYETEKRIVIASLLANGHVLLEGVPGIAKTTLVKALARVFGLSEKSVIEINGVPYKGFSRIQFTPDLMPADITGSLVFNMVTKEFETRFGPIFSYVVLADEVNRAVPRTQSALLQAMQEREVTIGGWTYPLEVRSKGKFFFVLATQNPVEQEGTYPLPEAQLDRFMVRIFMGYPRSLNEERRICELHMQRLSEPVEDVEKVVDPLWIVEVQEYIAKNVKIDSTALNYIVSLVRATRAEIFDSIAKYFELGASPRAAIALMRLSKSVAAMRGSEAVAIEDVEQAAFHVLNHRVIPNLETVMERGGGFKTRIAVVSEGLELAKKVARGGRA
ncbi:MAG: AAA family ATPase [Thaumarchaeota archaeon]|nr:AAA family ATPase [Candidatus Geocrenenecus arthurdayi]